MPKKTIFKEIIQEEGIKARALVKGLRKEGELSSLQRREQLFKKNMGLS